MKNDPGFPFAALKKISVSTALAGIAGALMLLATPVRATIVVSDFSDFGAQFFAPMGGSWSNAGTDQYIQEAGFISIAPVSGGNPAGDGYFFAGILPAPGASKLDLTGLTTATLTARADAGNASSFLTLLFYDSSFNTAAPVASATFLASDFENGFSTANRALTFTGLGDPTDVTYWRVEGDGLASDAFRFSFDTLVVAVPEPACLGLLGLGFAAIGLRVRTFRRKAPCTFLTR